MQIVATKHAEVENLHILKLARKTAKIPSITSRAVDIIRTAYLSTLLT